MGSSPETAALVGLWARVRGWVGLRVGPRFVVVRNKEETYV